MTWAQTEGPICAPETSHAIACVIEEAVKAREEGKEKVILFNYSGHGLMDLTGYDKYIAGQLSDFVMTEAEVKKTTEELKQFPPAAARKTGKW
jgi:tryptophan synthase beta chain